jgi:hypothetical protein
MKVWWNTMGVIAIGAFLLGGCSDGTGSTATSDIVVRGYLYAGQPVDDIQLTSSLAIGATDTVGPPVSDAVVRLTRNGVSFLLAGDPARPGYYRYEENDLQVASGDQFGLSAIRAGQEASATTTVPNKPHAITSSAETLGVSLRAMFGSFKEVYSDDSIVVSWSGADGDLYYTLVKNVDANPVAITTDTLRGFDFMSQPTSQVRYQVPVRQLRHTGQYRLLVYRVNQEYADLYRSRQQDNRTLNEPFTNIRNGLGVFSAFAADSVVFYVRLE